MNEYRKQQLRAARLIEQGADAEQVAEVYGWIRGEPERSGTTGHNQTLTAPRKCGIIKAIRRHVRRWKRKQEGKAMKAYYAYHARGFENEYIIIFADDEQAKTAAKNYENERTQRGGNPLFYRITRKQAEKMCDIETAENIRDRLPGLF